MHQSQSNNSEKCVPTVRKSWVTSAPPVVNISIRFMKRSSSEATTSVAEFDDCYDFEHQKNGLVRALCRMCKRQTEACPQCEVVYSESDVAYPKKSKPEITKKTMNKKKLRIDETISEDLTKKAVTVVVAKKRGRKPNLAIPQGAKISEDVGVQTKATGADENFHCLKTEQAPAACF